MTSWGDILRACRKKAGLTGEQVAEKSGLSLGTLRRSEADKNDPKLSQYAAMLKACGYEMIVAPIDGNEED